MVRLKNSLFYGIIIIVISSITSCSEFNSFTSGVLIEKAEVVQLSYVPDTCDSQLAPGIGINGNVSFTIIDTGHEEIWAVVFKCQEHNKVFSLQGKEIYEKVKVGQIVDLEYKEIYKIKDNKKIVYNYKTIKVIVP